MAKKKHIDIDKQPASRSLIIGNRQKETLSKQQQTFNRLVKRIEKLRHELEQTNSLLGKKLDFYTKQVYPLLQQLTALRKECIKLMYRFFKDKKLSLLSAKEKMVLKEVMSVQLTNIFSFEKEEPDDEFKEIFKAVEGVSYEKAAEQDFADMKDEMQDIFNQYGFDMDFDDMHSKMTQEEMIRKMQEKHEQLTQKAEEEEQKQASRKKSKKQLEREAREKLIEEARAKNISSIYKQLAKVFHPDLEQDAGLKLQKEELMKQLTNAYENNDLHTLLRLELQWIQKEENNPDKLTDDKLAIYNEVLKEQVEDLEEEIEMLFEHPRYQPLRDFTTFFDDLKSINLNQQKSQLLATFKDMSSSVEKLKGNEKQAVKEIKDIIRYVREQQKMDDEMERYFR